MKSSPDISWNEKGELKYKGETVQGSNVVELVKSTQFWTSFLLLLGVFGEYVLIGEGLCCRL
jgi:hypothetical protein